MSKNSLLEIWRNVKSLAWKAWRRQPCQGVRRLSVQGPIPAAPSVGELTWLRTFYMRSVRYYFLKRKMNKAVQGHFPCRVSLMRQPQGRSPGPSLRPSQELHKLLTQASLAQHFAWAGIALASAREIFGLNESFWIVFPMDPTYSTHPLLNMCITTYAQYTHCTHSLCLKLSFVLDPGVGREGWNTALCSPCSGAVVASAAKGLPGSCLERCTQMNSISTNKS